MMKTLKRWAKAIKTDIVALWIAARDARTPVMAKVVAGVVAAYALSPIDLIPDFVPVVGYLDDLLLVPLGILLAVRLIPSALMVEFRGMARQRAQRPGSRAGLIVVLTTWFLATLWVGWLVWHRMVQA